MDRTLNFLLKMQMQYLSDDDTFALEALINLGYMKNDVEKVLRKLDPELRLEDKIKLAMKNLKSKR